MRPLLFISPNVSPEGAPLIDLRLGVDIRTNSVIVAGSENDLLVVEALITRLEDSKVEERRNDVYRLVNSTAIDVATALNNFITANLNVYTKGNQLAPFQDLLKEVVVVPEPITNKLLVSATPRYYADVMRLIAELDAELPQVMIQVLIAEVDLNNTEEFGVEIGLQSPVFFQRGLFGGTSTSGITGTGAATAAAATGTSSAVGIGFPFNNPSLGLPNVAATTPGIVGWQGLGSFGTGRVSPNAGIGGFVFSAASDSFNLLIRALKVQGRADILSRPQIMTLDNQAAQVAVGQSVPYLGASTLTGTGVTQQSVLYQNVGVIMNVIPKISPDNKVTMRITPQISSVAGQATLGNGVQSPIFNQQILDTTVIARDGETVAIGGLITRSDQKNENKIPWVGDLPVIGAAFRYRQQIKRKQELLVILTPRIIRNRLEMERVLAEESRKMDWVVGDALRTHGTTGMHPLFAPPPGSGPGSGLPGSPPLPGAYGPAGGVDGNLMAPAVPQAPPRPILPLPRTDPGKPLPAGPTGGPTSALPPVSPERPFANLSAQPLQQGGPPSSVKVELPGVEPTTATVQQAGATTTNKDAKEGWKWRPFGGFFGGR
jgi:type II secretory pathway component GspD/PulD (secretin)